MPVRLRGGPIPARPGPSWVQRQEPRRSGRREQPEPLREGQPELRREHSPLARRPRPEPPHVSRKALES